jgi:tRNA-2-methylthio-N6-dimethylallyladenosine synthase
MNFSDSEIVASILSANGYNTTQVLEEADLFLDTSTCPFEIRTNSENV